MSTESHALLPALAARYIWWQTPTEAMRQPARVIAQVMDLGTLEDADQLEAVVGPTAMIDVLHHAQAGWFRPRSWSYWHHRLGLTTAYTTVPDQPARKISA